MKYFLIPIFIATASSAYADSIRADIEDHYTYISKNIPTTKLECREVKVPVYSNTQKGNAAEGALLGMIIGGIGGKAITGNNDGAAAGAVIGGIIGADQAQQNSRVATGYRLENKCEEITYYTETKEKVYDYSTISFKVNGERYTLRFIK